MASNDSNGQVYSSEDDLDSIYSENFEHVSHSPTPESQRRNNPGNKRNGDNFSLKSDTSSSSIVPTSHYNAKQSNKSELRKKTSNATVSASKKSRKSTTYSKDPKRKPPLPKMDHVRARMLSAQRNRLNTLNDELSNTQTKLEQLVKENRLLKSLQYRQDKALRKFEDTEGELPKLINRHMDEERVLKARLRKTQDSERRLEAKLRDTNEEFQKMETTLHRLKKIVYDKNLGERSDLTKQLNTAEDRLIEWERKNKELEKKVELTTQSFARQINGERAKHRETKHKLETLQDEYRVIQTKLKEKERALEVSNIYALRSKPSPEKSSFGKMIVASPRQPGGKPSPIKDALSPLSITSSTYSVSSLSITELSRSKLPLTLEPPLTNAIQAPHKASEHIKTSKSPAPAAPHDVREDSSLLDFGSSNSTEHLTNDVDGRHFDVVKKRKELKERSENKINRSVFLTANFDSPNSTFISDGAPSTAHDRSPLPDTMSRYSPKPHAVAVEQKRSDEDLEQEITKLEKERRLKAELLSKLKDVEEESNFKSSSIVKKSTDDEFQKIITKENSSKKKIREKKDVKQERVYESNQRERFERKLSFERKLIEKLTDNASTEQDTATESLLSQDKVLNKKHINKSYRFPQEVENLHKGLPSTSDVSKGLLEQSEQELTFGGYAPTVTSVAKRKSRGHHSKNRHSSPDSEPDEPLLDVASGKVKKPDLLQQLFGEQAARQQASNADGLIKKENSFASSRENSMIKTTPRSKPVHTGYPWERNVMPASQQGNGDGYREKSKNGDSALNGDEIEEVLL